MFSQDVTTKLYIRKREASEWLVLWIVCLPFAFGLFFSLLNAPALIKYTVDLAWLSLFFILVIKKSAMLHKRLAPLLILITAFFVYTLVIYLFNFQSPFYYLWGVRNNFRFYVFFFAVVSFLDGRDAEAILKIFDTLFWINAVICLVQYFAFGYKQDYLGGIFGVERGANAYTIIFFILIVSKSLLSYMSKRETTFSCFLKCGTALFIAALAELKAFFAFFVIVLVLSAILTAFSWRKVGIIFLVAIVAVFASALLTTLFGFDSSLSLENIWELATQKNYSASGTVNRLSAIPVLAKTIVTELHNRIFGLGLGNCDTSNFEICNSTFYQNYGHLRYNWFSCAILFLETGYIGLIIYMAFFVFCYIAADIQRKNVGSEPLYCQMAMIMSVMCVLFVFYNSSLRTEAAYMVYFVLSLPFIRKKADRI